MANDPISYARTTQVRLRRGTTAQIAANPPIEAEPFYDLTEKRIGVGGTTEIIEQWKSQFLEHTADATDAVARNMQEKLTEVVSVKDFGAVGDGVTDDTAAIQKAVNAAVDAGNSCVYVPQGVYKISDVITIPQGVPIIGNGGQGSSVDYGVSIVHASNGNCFVFDGNGADFAGTGGALKNMIITKASGFSGGDAIKLVGTDDGHRPGEMMLENLLVYQGSGGNWSRGLNIDGTANTTPGSKGVRSICLIKVRIADCSTNNEYIVFNQAVHVTGNHVQVDTGSGTGTCGITIKGDSDNIIIPSAIINGNLVVSPSSTSNIYVSGRVSTLNITTANANGAFVGQLGSLTANSSANTFSVISGSNWFGPLNVGSSFTVNTDAFTVDPTNKRFTFGGQSNLGFAGQGVGNFGSEVKSTVTSIGTAGIAFNTSCPNTETFTFDTSSGKMFHISTGGGAAALIFADYKQTTIDIISDPSSEFEASSTPTSGKTGIFKSVNSHTISIKNNTGGLTNYGVLVLGVVLNPTNPA